MVVPVVVISDVEILRCTLAQTEEVTLAAVEEMVVRKGDICGLFAVERAVTLSLIGIAACLSVKEVAVVYPYMIVALLKAYVVALVAVNEHKAHISDLEV